MISCLTHSLRQHDIMQNPWYHPWYHKTKYDIIFKTPLFYPFLAPISIDITHDNIAEIMDKGYDIKNLWYQWYLSYGFAYDMAW